MGVEGSRGVVGGRTRADTAEERRGCLPLAFRAAVAGTHAFFGVPLAVASGTPRVGADAGRPTCDGEWDTKKSMGAGDGGSEGEGKASPPFFRRIRTCTTSHDAPRPLHAHM